MSSPSKSQVRIDPDENPEDHYLQLFDLNPQAMWVYDLQSLRFLAVNKAAISRYGYEREEFLAMTIADIRANEDAERLLKNIHSTQEGRGRAGAWRHRRKDGTLIAVEMTSQAIVFSGQACELVIADDVSARQLASERLRLALDAAQFGVWEVTLPHRELIWDKVCGQIFGRQPDAYPANGREFLELVHPEDRDLVSTAIQDTVLHGTEYRSEFRILRPDGEVRWHAVFGRRTLALDGSPSKIIGVCTDSTLRKQMEQQLHQSLKMEALGRLAGGIAHDFNNLLTVINGHSELLLHQLPSEHPVREPVNEIRRAAKRAANLTFKLLAFSRSEPIETKLLDLNSVVRESRILLRQIIGDTFQVRVRCRSHAALIRAGRTQIDQVILNLCINARDTIPGGGEIRIQTDQIHLKEQAHCGPRPIRPGIYVTLLISGISKLNSSVTEQLRFEPFFTSREMEKGIGLGLAIVHGIIEESGGFLEMTTHPEHRQSFRILFPAV